MNQKAKICDFGLTSNTFYDSEFQTTVLASQASRADIGTVEYIAPEQT